MYNKKYLQMGIKIEMEHARSDWTPQHNRNQAERIAKNHLKEHPSYYLILPGAEKRMAAIDKQMQKRKH